MAITPVYLATIPQYGQAGSYTAQLDRYLAKANAVTQGVRNIPTTSTGDLAVTTTGSANMSVLVATGDLWIANGSQEFYYSYNAAVQTVGQFNANSSGATRTDLVYAQVIDTGTGGPISSPSAANLAVQITIGQGSTVVPAKAIPLASVAIPNGTTGSFQIQSGWITDLRPKAQLWDFTVASTSNVASPIRGNMIYDTSVNRMKTYNGSTWDTIPASPSGGFSNTDMASGFTLTYSSLSTSAPTNLYNGLLWYQTDTDRLLEYDGTNWVRISWNSSTGRTGCTVRDTSTTSQGNGSQRTASFNVEDYDSDGFITAPSSTITIPSGLGGLYSVSFSAKYAGTGIPIGAAIRVSASGVVYGYLGANVSSANLTPNDGINSTGGISTVLPLAAGDTLIFYSTQNSGTSTTAAGARADVYRIGA